MSSPERPIVRIQDINAQQQIGNAMGNDAGAEAFSAHQKDRDHRSPHERCYPHLHVNAGENGGDDDKCPGVPLPHRRHFEIVWGDEGSPEKIAQKNSSMKGTTNVGPSRRMVMNVQSNTGDEKFVNGSSDSKWARG